MNPFERMKYDSLNKDKSFTSIKIKLLQKARIRNTAYMTKNSSSQRGDLKYSSKKETCGRKKFDKFCKKKVEIQQLQK